MAPFKCFPGFLTCRGESGVVGVLLIMFGRVLEPGHGLLNNNSPNPKALVAGTLKTVGNHQAPTS